MTSLLSRNKTTLKNQLFEQIAELLASSRQKVVKAINNTMVTTYFEIGKMIVEHEQGGEVKAEYGKNTLKSLSIKLTKEFGRGFSVQNLENMRRFYATFQKSQTVSRKLEFTLSWSHYVRLLNLKSEQERIFYELESTKNNWSIRELDRQINSALFERIALSVDKSSVLKDNLQKYHQPRNPQDILKDPYILEFLNLDEQNKYSENDLEGAIITNLQKFLLEMGKGFSFVSRQKRMSSNLEHFYVDLVFYNRLLKCFVLIDLKIGKLTHQDIGQMQMYVNMFDRLEKETWENPTIGLVLCKEKDEVVAEYTLPKDTNIFTSEYKLILPSKEELQKELKNVVERTNK